MKIPDLCKLSRKVSGDTVGKHVRFLQALNADGVAFYAATGLASVEVNQHATGVAAT